MDKNFLMLNFCTEYSSKGCTHKKFSREVCFGTIFRSEGNGIIQKNDYIIKLHKVGDYLKKRHNNACFTNREGIIRHLKILKLMFKFSYHLKEEKDHFILTLSLKGDLIYHKYMLTFIRYLYEYPFNMFLMDAYKLKTIPDFKFESIINLFNIIGATSGINDFGTDIHAIGKTWKFKELYTIKEMQQRLKVLCGGYTRVNSILRELSEEDYDFKTINADDNKLHSLDYWDSEEEFLKRLELYKENYKILKNLKKE